MPDQGEALYVRFQGSAIAIDGLLRRPGAYGNGWLQTDGVTTQRAASYKMALLGIDDRLA
jgi:hypothetical protein